MEYQLKNEYLTVTAKKAGAELTSVKNNEGLEFLWCGDKKYWGRQAPVLFPIVGKVNNNTYTHEGRTYHLTQHGFARDMEFDEVTQKENELIFCLRANEQTKEKYPFEFQLSITYTLIKNTIKVTYEVENCDTTKMYFTIGAHPAFNCPMVEGEQFEDYYFEFEKAGATRLIATSDVLLTGEEKAYNDQIVPLSLELFKEDAIILSKVVSDKVTLKSSKNSHSVSVNRKGMPFLGLWSPVGGAPFVCIEPWMGHTDYLSNGDELSEKKDFISLETKEKFSCSYELTFK